MRNGRCYFAIQLSNDFFVLQKLSVEAFDADIAKPLLAFVKFAP